MDGELNEKDVERVADRALEKMANNAWIEQECHYLDHKWAADRRHDEENERARRAYVDYLIDLDRKNANSKRSIRDRIVGGVAITAVLGTLGWVGTTAFGVLADMIKSAPGG